MRRWWFLLQSWGDVILMTKMWGDTDESNKSDIHLPHEDNELTAILSPPTPGVVSSKQRHRSSRQTIHSGPPDLYLWCGMDDIRGAYGGGRPVFVPIVGHQNKISEWILHWAVVVVVGAILGCRYQSLQLVKVLFDIVNQAMNISVIVMQMYSYSKIFN